MNVELISVFAQFGFAGVIFFALVLILKWMMHLHDTVMNDSKEERKVWQTMVNAFSDRLNEHTNNAKAFHEQVTEAHKFQREEHKNMCENQIKMSHTLDLLNNKLENKQHE
jgi:hypothetical protein